MFRNWFWISHVIAVLGYWVYPLAPPRLTDLGLADPTKESLELGGALAWFQPFRNEFAAMPSMHVGYTFLFALALFMMLRPSPWRWLAWIWPAAMLFVVMATANHWWLDAFLGAATAAVSALAAQALLARARPDAWAWNPSPRPAGGSTRRRRASAATSRATTSSSPRPAACCCWARPRCA